MSKNHVIYNNKMECIGRDELHQLQGVHLRKTVEHVYNNVPFYKTKMDAIGIKPEDINSADDVKLLPFTEKDDLRDNYPFGLFAVPQSEIIRIHASSGTTGKPTVVGYTKSDIDIWAELMARTMACAGATNNDILQVAYGYGLFTGGLGAHYGGEKLGASVIPMSSGNTQKQIMLMEDFGTTMFASTPSYALMLGEKIDQMGIRDRLKLKRGIFGAEPWTEGMRRRIEALLGIVAIDIYGLSEVMGPGVSTECLMQNGMHIWEDHFIAEIINPETGESIPDGEYGEIVFTTITKQGQPLLRYRTHDITLLDNTRCECGRTHVRMKKVRGRSDDMLIIRGVNLFPTQIEGVLANIPGIMPHYLLIVDRKNNLDTLEVRVELTPALVGDTIASIENLRTHITAQIISVTGLHVDVRLVEPNTIQRSEGKAKRVIDNRKME